MRSASVAFCARTGADVDRAAEEMTGRGGMVPRALRRCLATRPACAWVGAVAAELGRPGHCRGQCQRAGHTGRGGQLARELRRGHDGHGSSGQRRDAAHLERSEAASIVTIASVSGRRWSSPRALRTLHEGGDHHYTQGLAYQLAAKDIRANSLSPGKHLLAGATGRTSSRAIPSCCGGAGTEPHGADGAAGGDRRAAGIPGAGPPASSPVPTCWWTGPSPRGVPVLSGRLRGVTRSSGSDGSVHDNGPADGDHGGRGQACPGRSGSDAAHGLGLGLVEQRRRGLLVVSGLPVSDMRAAISPETSGVEKDVRSSGTCRQGPHLGRYRRARCTCTRLSRRR